MPRRRRVSKSTQGPMTLKESIVWGIYDRTDLIDHFGTLEAARSEWSRRKPLVDVNEGTQPEAFWALDGPPHLRNPPAKPPATSHEDNIAKLDALEAKRGAWLDAYGGDWRLIELSATPRSQRRTT